MANHLDLEEQEQLDQLKHFWAQYGNLITWVLILALAAVAAWNGYQYWQNRQSSQASALYDEVERAATAGDVPMLERALADIKDRNGSTTYASQAALLGARVLNEKGKADAARASLKWVADNSPDDGYKALARIRLAGLMMETQAYDEALQVLAASMPAEFAPLAADRKGDILLLQGKRDDAKAEYTKAYEGMNTRVDYRRMIEIKLNALGVDASKLKKPAASGAPETAK